MFQRFSSLFFGTATEMVSEPKVPKPTVLEADEEGWLLISFQDASICDETRACGDLCETLRKKSLCGSPVPLDMPEDALSGLVSMISSTKSLTEAKPSDQRSNSLQMNHPADSRVGMTKVMHASRIHRSQVRAEGGSLGLRHFRRQNCVRQHVPRRFLQQPCPRNYSH